MKLDDILSSAGANKRSRRYGRGTGSGRGKRSGRGQKGRGARAGSGVRMGYEGGQNPIFARSPKRGFNNFNFRVEYDVVNVRDLEKFDSGARIDKAALMQAGLLNDSPNPLKVLGTGELTKKLTVVAAKFSASAAAKITQAGGTVEQA